MHEAQVQQYDVGVATRKHQAEWFYTELNNRFECKDPQWLEPSKPLDHISMVIILTEKGIYPSMESYIKTMLVKLNMQDPLGLNVCTPICKPIEDLSPSWQQPPQNHRLIQFSINHSSSSEQAAFFMLATSILGWLASTCRSLC